MSQIANPESLQELARLDRSLEEQAPSPVVVSTSRGSSSRSRRSTGRLLGVLTELRQMSGELSNGDSLGRLSKQLPG
jgi:hypothetical protein